MNTHYVQERLSHIADWAELGRRAHYRATELDQLCGVTRRSLERFFQMRFGKAPQECLDELRHHDLECLLRSERQLKEIAFLAGYKQPSHMTRQFKQRHGVSPSEWRVNVTEIDSPPTTVCTLIVSCRV